MVDPVPVPAPPGGSSAGADTSIDSLRSPTFIIAICLLCIAAGTIAAVFWKGNAEVQNVVAGSVIGAIIGNITGYYYGAAKHITAPTSTSTPDRSEPNKVVNQV